MKAIQEQYTKDFCGIKFLKITFNKQYRDPKNYVLITGLQSDKRIKENFTTGQVKILLISVVVQKTDNDIFDLISPTCHSYCDNASGYISWVRV